MYQKHYLSRSHPVGHIWDQFEARRTAALLWPSRGLNQGSTSSLKSHTGWGTALGPKADRFGCWMYLFPIPIFPSRQNQKTSRHLGPSPKTLPPVADACSSSSPQGSHCSMSAPAGQPMGTGKHNMVTGGFQTNKQTNRKNHKVQAEKKSWVWSSCSSHQR